MRHLLTQFCILPKMTSALKVFSDLGPDDSLLTLPRKHQRTLRGLRLEDKGSDMRLRKGKESKMIGWSDFANGILPLFHLIQSDVHTSGAFY